MTYSIVYTELAQKQLKKIPKADAVRIVKKIQTFANDPRPHNYKKLEYHTEYFRFRIGNYRVIYQIADSELIVTIIEVRRRNEATY